MARKIEINEEKKLLAEKQIVEKIKSYDYDTVEYPIGVLIDLYEKGLDNEDGEIYIPDYQREFVWDERRKVKFIESVILGIPIPYIFFADVEGRYEIVDGSQRIRTLHAFLKNELQLQGMVKLTQLNGFYFKDLPQVRQRRIKKKSLKMIALSEKTDSEARLDLFERINTGSDELKSIEIRKGVYRGEFYDFLTECSNNPLFKKLCPISEKRTLRDEPQEMILRFFAYSENLENYNAEVRKFIDKYIKSKVKSFNRDIKDDMSKYFIAMLEFVDKNFENGFKKTKNAKTTPRVRFEALSVGTHFALLDNPSLQVRDVNWIHSDAFKMHTRSDAANNKNKVTGRINYVKEMLLGE